MVKALFAMREVASEQLFIAVGESSGVVLQVESINPQKSVPCVEGVYNFIILNCKYY